MIEANNREVEAAAGTHIAKAAASDELPAPSWEMREPVELNEVAPATRATFMARWTGAPEAMGYRLDVSTRKDFTTFLEGYRDRDVGRATGEVVTGLAPGTTYYYRVRAYNLAGLGANSATAIAETATTGGLIINPTFDSSILNSPNSAAIQANINQAIAIYESLFTDPITIQMYFRYATTGPDGSVLSSGTLAASRYVTYTISWSTVLNALKADAKDSNDATANASLPASPLASSITVSSANGRAVSLNTAPAMFSDGSVAAGGPYDGIVTLNSSQPFQFSRPTSTGTFDALRSIEHEMDEVMGLAALSGTLVNGCASTSSLRPQDLFSWSSSGTRNLCVSGTRYFSINSGATNIVSFNQTSGGDFGDWISASCPQSDPYVQNAFSCKGQFSDVTATSPEGVNLDVIGYDLLFGNTRSDFNRDGISDLVWQNNRTGQRTMWLMTKNGYTGVEAGFGPVATDWQIATTGDFNGDGLVDIVWQNTASGQRTIWLMNGTGWSGQEAAFAKIPVDWQIAAAADFDGDGRPDIVWQNLKTGQRTIWLMNGTQWSGVEVSQGTVALDWQIVGTGDFNRDGNIDILWQNTHTGGRTIWLMNRTHWTGSEASLPSISVLWDMAGTGDFNVDGNVDIVWQHKTSGQRTIWLMNGTQWSGTEMSLPTISTDWEIRNH
jgi:hypothetical protein